MSTTGSLPGALVTLLDSLIDYAGLFPPAGLSMRQAVRRFADHRAGPDAWALGRFVVPASRLEEFESEVARLEPPSSPWPLSVLVSADTELDRVVTFGAAHPAGGGWPWRVRSVEVKVARVAEIQRIGRSVSPDLEIFFEVAAEGSMADLYAAAARGGHGLKIRTGGTSVDAFPPSAVVARFLAACAEARVPFKATAGLHHPVRSPHPVTYEPGAPSATMHGFLNLFVAAALLAAGRADTATATRVLEDEVPASFRPDAEGISWRDLRLTRLEVSSARTLARGFGSCSFDEPLRELSAIL